MGKKGLILSHYILYLYAAICVSLDFCQQYLNLLYPLYYLFSNIHTSFSYLILLFLFKNSTATVFQLSFCSSQRRVAFADC